MSNLLFIFPTLSFIASLLDGFRPQAESRPIGVFASSLPHSVSAVLSIKQVSLYALLTGILLGFCYNVYPKTTRLAGSYEGSSIESAFGLVTMPIIRLYLILTAIMAVLVIAWKASKRNRIYLIGIISTILFAATFFSLPLMQGGVFELLLASSLAISMPVWLGALYLFSTGEPRRCLSQILCLCSGLIVGSLIAAGLIELTTPNPYVIAPQAFQNLTIISVPTICFVATLIVILFIVNSTTHSGQLAQEEKTRESEMASTTQQLVARYSLTNRESEILELLLVGRSGTYISKQLSLSASTVKTHIRHIYGKLGISSKQELIDLAQEQRASDH